MGKGWQLACLQRDGAACHQRDGAVSPGGRGHMSPLMGPSSAVRPQAGCRTQTHPAAGFRGWVPCELLAGKNAGTGARTRSRLLSSCDAWNANKHAGWLHPAPADPSPQRTTSSSRSGTERGPKAPRGPQTQGPTGKPEGLEGRPEGQAPQVPMAPHLLSHLEGGEPRGSEASPQTRSPRRLPWPIRPGSLPPAGQGPLESGAPDLPAAERARGTGQPQVISVPAFGPHPGRLSPGELGGPELPHLRGTGGGFQATDTRPLEGSWLAPGNSVPAVLTSGPTRVGRRGPWAGTCKALLGSVCPSLPALCPPAVGVTGTLNSLPPFVSRVRAALLSSEMCVSL